MRYRPTWWISLPLATGIIWASATMANAQSASGWPRADRAFNARQSVMGTASALPLDEMSASSQQKVRGVIEHPTLSIRGQPERFPCQPTTYHWLLDHPDRAAVAWRRLGAKVVDMADEGNGRFGWTDHQGSELHWSAVHCGAQLRIWHAEGKIRPGSVLPAVPVQAVVVLRYQESRDAEGQVFLTHQAELILHTDSKAMALAARLFGASAPRLAEQYVSQVEMFFSALAWYLDQHPEKLETLLAR
jgi:hypothetical protein